MKRRTLLQGLAANAAMLAAARSWAKPWPERTVRMMDAYATGSASDTTLRLIAPHLQKAFGEAFIVENRPGASGNIAAQACASAKPDGYTFLMSTNTMMTANPFLFTKGRIDPFKEFTFVVPTVNMGMVFVVQPDSPWKTIEDLLNDAKKNPDKLTYGTPGVGSPMHLIGELIKSEAGAAMRHVPYKGGMPMVQDVMAGQISVGIVAYSVVAGMIPSKLVPIAVAGRQRISALKNTPAIAEFVPAADLAAWGALVGPAGLPPDIGRQMAREVGSALALPDVVEKLQPLGLEKIPGDANTIANMVRTESAIVGPLIKRLGISFS